MAEKVPVKAIEAGAAAYEHGVYPGDESEASLEEVRAMTERVLQAAFPVLTDELAEARSALKEAATEFREASEYFDADGYQGWALRMHGLSVKLARIAHAE